MKLTDVTFDNFLSLTKSEQELIFNNVGFLQELVRKNVTESRYYHSLSTANVAKQLAKYHNIDPDKAYLCGILHDCCKFPDSSRSGVLEEYLRKYEPEKLNGIFGAYHSWVAPYYLKEKLNFADEEILNAIYNHTILVDKTPFNLIIYLADKREPLRGVDDDILEIAKTDLNKAYDQLVVDVEQFVKSKNEKFVGNSL